MVSMTGKYDKWFEILALDAQHEWVINSNLSKQYSLIYISSLDIVPYTCFKIIILEMSHTASVSLY